MSKVKQMVPGTGVKPKAGQKKVKITKPGGKRTWVLVKSGTVLGGKMVAGSLQKAELSAGVYEASRQPHPNNPSVEALVVQDQQDGKEVFIIEKTFANRTSQVQVLESESVPDLSYA